MRTGDEHNARPRWGERAFRVTWRASFAVFGFGVVATSLFAFVRMVRIGIRRTNYFGGPTTNHVEYAEDPWLWVTAIILTASVVLLGGMVLIEAIHRRWLVSGIVCAVLGAVPALCNWYLLSLNHGS